MNTNEFNTNLHMLGFVLQLLGMIISSGAQGLGPYPCKSGMMGRYQGHAWWWSERDVVKCDAWDPTQSITHARDVLDHFSHVSTPSCAVD